MSNYTTLEFGWYFAIGCILEHGRSHVFVIGGIATGGMP